MRKPPAIEKKVTIIPAKPELSPILTESEKILRVAAYCRVSTTEKEQLSSYENQVNYYTELISKNPQWVLCGIYADKGISGTSTKHREEFNRLIAQCRKHRIDMIITKSISRFARNTLDCLKYTRELKELGVDVFFEEQGIHSIQPGAEFYITIYGSIAQSESENISANIRWGLDKACREGKVPFRYGQLIGFRKGEDGKPEIDPETAPIIQRIYREYMDGASLVTIANGLEADHIPTPMGKTHWAAAVVKSILTNVKYKGDVLMNKTFVVDCISKKVKRNNGERPQYYIENNHPAIIEPEFFGRVQEEYARRNAIPSGRKNKTPTEQGKYSSKYALTERLICGECGTPYRRAVWTARGQYRVVWRCISRLDYGKKYCKHSPTLDEDRVQNAVMNAISQMAQSNHLILDVLQMNISQVILKNKPFERIDLITSRIEVIDMEFKSMLDAIAADNMEAFDEERAKNLLTEKETLMQERAKLAEAKQRTANAESRMEEIAQTLELIKNCPMEYSDVLVRKLVDKVVVLAADRIKVIFEGGTEIIVDVETGKLTRKSKG